MKKKQLKPSNQDSNETIEIPSKELYEQYIKEYQQLVQEREEQYHQFIHAKSITDINKFFINIDLTRIEPIIEGNIIPKYDCCIENCNKLCLYEMKYNNNKKYICWFHLCGIINKY
jgi:hypothetical protein